MAGWDDVSVQQPANWDAVSQAMPKMPDTSGIQAMAQRNLSVPKPDEEGAAQPVQTPEQRLDTAMGMPLAAMLKGNDTPITPDIRGQYTKAIQNGSASTFSDFMQTALHAVVPIASRIANPVASAENTAGSAQRLMDAAHEGISSGAEDGQVFPTSTLTGQLANVPFQVAASGFNVYQNVVSQAGIEAGFPKIGKELALLPEEAMGSEGIHMHLPETAPRAAGPWDNLPGREVIAKHVADVTGKPIDAVSSGDIDQTIATAFKDKAPPAQDFKDVATATGANEQTLHVIYKETGVKPDQVFEDGRNDPAVAHDVAAGKVPDAYEHLMEPKQTEGDGLKVARDDNARAFNVVDKEGDHVLGGFDSDEEARHYIEDTKEGVIPDEPPEWKDKTQDVFTPENAEATMTPKPPEGMYAAVETKVDGMSQEARDLRLGSLNKKMEAAIITPKEMAEREALNAKQVSRTPHVIPPAESGKPTSLRSFLSNNGAKFNEDNELVSIKQDGQKITGTKAQEYAHEISKDQGYLPADEANKQAAPLTDFKNLLSQKGGKEDFRAADADRVAKAQEAKLSRQNTDPARIEHEAHSVGIDTDPVKDETPQQHTKRLLAALQDFYKNDQGSVAGDAYRKTIGNTIIAAEKFTGKLTGDLSKKIGDAYIKTFQPELMGDKALRADAFLAKYKAAGQEAENAFYRASRAEISRWDKKTHDERMEWLYDHETGRWNEHDDPDHARYQALLDSSFKAEKESIGADADKGYKENYLPHIWEKPDEVKAFFQSETMMKKYGQDGFTKASTFKLIQDGVRAGFKLKTDNPESMLVSRLLAGNDMIRTMDLLHDMEGSGLAKKATAFSLDKRITKASEALAEAKAKYQAASDKINDPKQARWDFADPAVSKYMTQIEKRITNLEGRLSDYNKDKADNKLSPNQMKDLKGGFRVIGPDNKVWNIHQELGPLWKNAMEAKGLWENQGVVGDAYRVYTAGKATWVAAKLGLSLFHPVHVAMIDLASDMAAAADHLIQGGKFSDLATKEGLPNFGITKDTFKGKDHPAVAAWQTAPEARTPEQARMVQTMVEGGFKPTMSARDTIHFRDNFDKAIKGVGVNNLRLLGTAVQIPGKLMAPFFEHWIPGLKSEIYLRRADDAMKRDPSLATDAGRRGEALRQIAKDTDRTYGEMNNDVQFWNRTVRDSFNAAFISGGWKLAQIYNARGLLQPLGMAYKFAKTGEFSKADITYNMLQAYAYTGLTLATGAAINTMLGNPIGSAKDTVWDIVKNLVFPKTGENNPDGTPIRLSQPAFAKDAYMLAHDINTKGLIAGSGSFMYHQTLIPGIVDTLNNRDFVGRKIISDPADLHQWASAGWDAVKPISFSGHDKAEDKHSEVGKVAGVLGFPLAGAYINQTPFEQKVLATYSEQNPTKGDAYTAKLKGELKTAVASGDNAGAEEIKHRMKEEGMSDSDIAFAQHQFTKPFVDTAWNKLSSTDQRHLIESASEEEKQKFKVKTH